MFNLHLGKYEKLGAKVIPRSAHPTKILKVLKMEMDDLDEVEWNIFLVGRGANLLESHQPIETHKSQALY